MSKPLSLNREDLKKWAKNTLIFSIPLLGILAAVVKGETSPEVAQGAAMLYLLNSLMDLGRKFANES